ncbi:hypothetical protein ACEPUQ_28735 [Pseudomonas aeruginosa]
MSIDWSKAPEGANKAGFTGPDNYLQFYRIPGRFGDYDYWSENNGWRGTDFPTCANQLFERPAKVEWDGQGLPPVGTVCEFTHEGDGVKGRWIKCRVAGYTEGNRHVAVETDDDLYADEDGLVFLFTPQDIQWRPARTPEQIAAEAREAAIVAMLDLDPPHENGLGLTSRRQFCETLYDAGYRRQESST